MNECFICLEDVNCCKKKTLKCCKNQIHTECLVYLFLYDHENCPMCRSSMNVYNYLSKKEFKEIINKKDNLIVLVHTPKITEFYLNSMIHEYLFFFLCAYSVLVFSLLVYFFILKK